MNKSTSATLLIVLSIVGCHNSQNVEPAWQEIPGILSAQVETDPYDLQIRFQFEYDIESFQIWRYLDIPHNGFDTLTQKDIKLRRVNKKTYLIRTPLAVAIDDRHYFSIRWKISATDYYQYLIAINSDQQLLYQEE